MGGGDTTQVLIPSWINLFTKFNNEDYHKSTPHNNLEFREVDDAILLAIKKSLLYYVATREPIMPYVELGEWFISHTKAQNCRIVNEKEECIGSFLPQDINTYYKFPDPNEYLTK